MRLALPPGFARDSAHQYGLTAGLALSEFLYTALLARALGPDAFGLLVVLLGIARICQGVTDLRVHEFVIRYAGTALSRALRIDLLSTAAGAVLAIAVTFALPQLIPRAAGHEPLALLAIAATAAGWGGRFWSIGVFRLVRRVDLQALIQLAGSFGRLVVTAVWFALFSAGAAKALVISAICSGVAAVALVVAAKRCAGGLADAGGGAPGWRSYLAFNYGIGLLETAYRELDVQLVAWLGTLEQVSIFKIAKTFAGVVLQAVDPVVLLLLPQFARDIAARRFDELRRFIGQIAAGFAAAGLALGAASHFIIPLLLPLLAGPAYSASIGPFRVIVWCLVLTMPLLWTHAYAMAIGRPQLYFAASLAGVAVLVSLMAVLVPALGARGAAWAYGAGQIAVAALTLLLLATTKAFHSPSLSGASSDGNALIDSVSNPVTSSSSRSSSGKK